MKASKKKECKLMPKERLGQHQVMVKILANEVLPYIILVNPILASNSINIETDKVVENLQYKLYGCGGQQILRRSIVGCNTIIELDEFEVNTFLLIISETGREVSSYEIVKQFHRNN